MKRLLLIVAILLILAGPHPAAAQHEFAFGGQVEHTDSWPADTLRAAGMDWVKIQLFSADAITGNGIKFIQAAHSEGFKVLASVEGNRDHPTAEADQYISYLESLAGAGVDAIEIWNEPNYSLEFHGSAEQYAALYRRAYDTLKALYPDTLVITAALMPTETNNRVVTAESIWQSELPDLPADCVGIHYDDWPNTTLDQRLIQIQRIYGNKPLCFTELGVLSPDGFPSLPDVFWWAKSTTVQQQAATLHAMIDRLQDQTRMIIIWNVGFERYDSADPQAGYSIVRSDGTCAFCGLVDR